MVKKTTNTKGKVAIITGLFLIAIQGFPQKLEIISPDTTVIGKNFLTDKRIIAEEVVFTDRIYDLQYDTTNNHITFQLRDLNSFGNLKNRGHLLRYDLEENKVLWSNKLSFKLETIRQFNGLLLDTYGGWTYCLDNETGENKWQNKKDLFFADTDHHMALGYEFHPTEGPENMLYGVSTKNGRTQWQREINREYGWSKVLYLNDTNLLIVAEGLHSLNLRNGKGWDYISSSGKKDYSKALVTSGLGFAVGLLTGVYVISASPDIISNISSNVIVDSLGIVFASKETIARLNKNGSLLWKAKLPSEWTSSSSIFKSGENIILLNRGYAYVGNRQTYFGSPFIASFNIESGRKNYLQALSEGEEKVVKSMKIIDDGILLVINNRLVKYNINNGSIELKNEINEYGELSNFTMKSDFLQMDSIFKSFTELDSTKHYIITKEGKALVLDKDLKVVGEFPDSSVYNSYLEWNGYDFIAHEEETFIVDNGGVKIAEIDANNQSKLWGDKLYNRKNNHFLMIDLKQLDKEKAPK